MTAVTTDGAYDQGLFEHLRRWRRTTADSAGVPAFLVFTDSTLQDLCRRRPDSLDDLLEVHGIGRHKSEAYGESVLAALRAYTAL